MEIILGPFSSFPEWRLQLTDKHGSNIEILIEERGKDVDGLAQLICKCLVSSTSKVANKGEEIKLSRDFRPMPVLYTVSFASEFSHEVFAHLESLFPDLLLLVHYDVPEVIFEEDDIEIMFTARRLCIHPNNNFLPEENAEEQVNKSKRRSADSDDDGEGRVEVLRGSGAVIGFDGSLLHLQNQDEVNLLKRRLRPLVIVLSLLFFRYNRFRWLLTVSRNRGVVSLQGMCIRQWSNSLTCINCFWRKVERTLSVRRMGTKSHHP